MPALGVPPGVLVLVCGVPGAGKSTAAEMVARRLDAHLLRTDVVRKELVDDPDYSAAETELTYREVCDRAERRLRDGETVVLDGTFRRQTQRDCAETVAARVGVPFRLVLVTCEDAVCRARIRDRERDVSDADVAVYETLRETFEPVEGDHDVVDNSGALAETEAQVEALF